MQIRRHFHFEAAHVLPYHLGKCSRPHGHSYRLEVGIRGPLQSDGPARGMIEDFDVLAATVRRSVIDTLDHSSLNDTLENPTCERLIAWIWERLNGELEGLDELVLWETPASCAVLRKGDFVRA